MIEHALLLAAAALVAYPYLGYPALMALAARRRPPDPMPPDRPRVSVIVAAFNEAAWIAKKIETTLAQDYPADRLEVVIVSDGSTDATVEVARVAGGPRVTVVAQPERRGKSPALNAGVRVATGEVLVFTDANALLAPDAIRRLAAPFADPIVGLVSGQGLYGEMGDGTARAVANGYVRLEAIVKSGESALGFVAGADGALYALRRSLYEELAPSQVNDLVHPIQAALAGYRSRFDPRAITVEPPSGGGGQELARHARIIAQGFAALAELAPRLLAAGRWRELWMVASHRLLRWISALGLAGGLGGSLLGDGPLFRLALAGQAVFYGLAVAGWLGERAGWRLGRAALPYYFCVVSGAGVLGFARFVRGGAQAVWTPRGRAMQTDPPGRAVGGHARAVRDSDG